MHKLMERGSSRRWRIVTTLLGLAALVICLVSPAATQSDKDGLAFLLECEGRHPQTVSFRELTCSVYLMGFVDAYQTTSTALRASDQLICLPKDGVQAGQLRLIVMKWLRDYPQDLHHSARGSVFLALRDVFRCAPGR